MLEYTISSDDHCRRLDSRLYRLLPAAAPSYIRKLIKSGACLLNSLKATPDTLLRCGDSLALKESGAVTSLLSNQPATLDILWQDDRLLAINKPAGLAMHPAAEVDENLADVASAWLSGHSGHQCRAYPVNRLDRGTSGAVLLATSSSSAGVMGRQVKEEGLDKMYLAVAEGAIKGDGRIDEPLDGKESSTSFYSLACSSTHTLILAEPLTGRTHQIRRHLSGIGHPVAGDIRYKAVPLPALQGFALHSFRTILKNPASGAAITVTAPVPMDMFGLIQERCNMTEQELLNLLWNIATRLALPECCCLSNPPTDG